MKPDSVLSRSTADRGSITSRLTIAAALALLAAALTVQGCSRGQRAVARAETEPAPMFLGASDLAVATRADLGAGIPVSGTLAPALDVRITSPAPELLDRVTVKEGQRVAKGEVLARFRASAIAPAAASAEAQRKIAAANHERMKNLLAQGAVSPHDVEKAEAELRAAEANAAAAGKRLAEATVRAPFAGVIAERLVQSGDRVGDGDPLFRLVNTSELEFEATVPSEFAARVRAGAPVSLTVTGVGGGSVQGKVARVNATADPATRQVKLYVTVPNPEARLVGDLFASGRILLESATAAAAVPSAAVRTDGQGTYAWVVENGKLARRPVTTGVRDEAQDLVEVQKGLAVGDRVVVGPVEGLQPGARVEVQGAKE